jgi:hypothetical protein
MFPLSQQFLFSSTLALFFAFYVACFAMTSRSWRFAIPPIAVFAASAGYGIWRISQATAEYEGLGIAVLVAINFGVLISAIVWVIFLRFGLIFVARFVFGKAQWKPRRSILMLLAISPAALTAVHAIERQSVPDAPCSTESVEVSLGKRTYVMYPELRARIEKTIPGRKHVLVLHYSSETKRKEHLKTICDLSEGGAKPISVDLLWLTPASIIDRADVLCADRSRAPEPFCSGIAHARYEHVHTIKLTTHPSEIVSVYGSWLQHENKPDLLTGGDLREGFVCHGTDNTVEQIRCTAWRPIDAETSVLARSMPVRGTTKTEMLSHVEDAVDFTLEAFSR